MDIESVILFQIDKTSKVSKAYSQKEFDRLGLGITVDQWILLKILDESGKMSQKELAEKSLRDPASITRTLDLLEKKDLLFRESIEGNRRKYQIVLTKNGKAFIEKHMDLIKSHRKLSVAGLSNNELKELTRMLEKIQMNMS